MLDTAQRRKQALHAAGLKDIKRREPVTKIGKARKAAGLPWVDEDYAEEAKEKGCGVEDLRGYGISAGDCKAKQKRLSDIIDAIGDMDQNSKNKLYTALIDSGYKL